jgi:hypothetical protein
MFGLGIPELIVIIIALVILFVQFYLPIYLRRIYPLKIWLGILLSILLIPFGHLYVDGSAIYIITLIVVAVVSKAFTGGFILAVIASPIIMYYRISKEINKSQFHGAPKLPSALGSQKGGGVFCTQCGTNNSTEARYCYKCGASLTRDESTPTELPR